MKKFSIQIFFLCLVIFGALYYSFNSQGLNLGSLGLGPSQTAAQKKLKINNTLINIEVADTPQLRKQGLGGRDSLPADSGMLFIFEDRKVHQFWMKGMKFALDFIFIDNGRVVDLLTNIQPPQPNQKDETLPIYQPVAPVTMVLEVDAGFISVHNIKIGDNVYQVE